MLQADVRVLDVWVVEDSGPLRAIILRMLEPSGARLTEAASLADCAGLLAAAPAPDVIFCDHGLPDGTAIDVAALLPEATRKLALTANSDPRLEAGLRQAGFHEVLVKPVRAADLLQALSRYSAPAQMGMVDAIPPELRESYARFVADETRAIAAAYASLAAPKLIHHLHKLAGTASVYGDKALARAAAACESRLRLGEPLERLRAEFTGLFENAGNPLRAG